MSISRGLAARFSTRSQQDLELQHCNLKQHHRMHKQATESYTPVAEFLVSSSEPENIANRAISSSKPDPGTESLPKIALGKPLSRQENGGEHDERILSPIVDSSCTQLSSKGSRDSLPDPESSAGRNDQSRWIIKRLTPYRLPI